MRFVSLIFASVAALSMTQSSGNARHPACAPDNAGLKLPAGFCATLFAESLAAPRHMVVAPNGDVIVAIRAGRDRPGGVVLLRDADGDGRAEIRNKFAEFDATEGKLLGEAMYT